MPLLDVRPHLGQMRRPPAEEVQPDPEQDAAIRAVWLDEARSLADRCRGVTDILGARVARFSLYRRYGKPGASREESKA